MAARPQCAHPSDRPPGCTGSGPARPRLGVRRGPRGCRCPRRRALGIGSLSLRPGGRVLAAPAPASARSTPGQRRPPRPWRRGTGRPATRTRSPALWGGGGRLGRPPGPGLPTHSPPGVGALSPVVGQERPPPQPSCHWRPACHGGHGRIRRLPCGVGATHQTVLERGTAEHSDRPHRGQASAVKSNLKPPELPRALRPKVDPVRYATADVSSYTTRLYTGIQGYAYFSSQVTELSAGRENST
jgi:hypothetical protein